MIRSFIKSIGPKQKLKSKTRSLMSLACFFIFIFGGLLVPNSSQAFQKGDTVVAQNRGPGGKVIVRWVSGISVPWAATVKGRVPNGTRGIIQKGPERGNNLLWYEVEWKILGANLVGWSAETVTEDGCKVIGAAEEADRRDVLVEALFWNIPHTETNHDYNGYGCDPNDDNACDGYRGGHSGWDAQTKSVAGELTADEEFYSLTTGKVIRAGGNFNTIAIYNEHDNKTTLYLHARHLYVDVGDSVEIGDRLGIQGDTGPGNITGEHVHIEVRDGSQTFSACGASTSLPPIDYLYESVTAGVPDKPDPIAPAVVKISPSPIESPRVGKQLTINITIEGGKGITGYQATVEFDTTALRYVSGNNSDYLPSGAYFVPPIVKGNRVTLGATSLAGNSDGDGILATIIFEVLAVKASTLTLSKVVLSGNDANSLPVTVENGQVIKPARRLEDVNGDGEVNILDLAKVASLFGQTVKNREEDVNGDGEVNILDLVMVAEAFSTEQGAPSVHAIRSTLTAVDIQQWLNYAQQLNLEDPEFRKGIAVLKQLLSTLNPNKTVLLANYPNPFNPETWIPYHLARPSDVSISIYAADGKLVRRLELGHQAVGIYESRSSAAYWDGKNALGEPVASGVYFYTLRAGEFTATRKMLIRK